MLDEAIVTFLEVSVSQEAYKLFEDSIIYIESLGKVDIGDQILNSIYTPMSIEEDSFEKPTALIIDEITRMVIKTIVDELSTSGIKVIEEVSLSDLHKLIVSIPIILDYEDCCSLQAICNSDEDSLVKMAELLEMVTEDNADQWLTILDEVSPEVIRNINQLLVQPVKDNYEEIEDREKYLSKLRVYKQMVDEQYPDLKVFDLIGSVELGQDLNVYMNKGYVDECYETNDMRKLAHEVYGLTMISRDALNDPMTKIKELMDDYISEMGQVMDFNKNLSDVNARYLKVVGSIRNM